MVDLRAIMRRQEQARPQLLSPSDALRCAKNLMELRQISFRLKWMFTQFPLVCDRFSMDLNGSCNILRPSMCS